MLVVTIANLDTNYVAIYDHDDEQKAVEAMLTSLIKNHGFFAENRIETDIPSTEYENLYGVLLLPDDEENIEYYVDHDCTYLIFVKKYTPGTILQY